MKAIMTTTRDIGDDKAGFLEYLAYREKILKMMGQEVPYSIYEIMMSGRSERKWIDEHKDWDTTTIVEIVAEA